MRTRAHPAPALTLLVIGGVLTAAPTAQATYDGTPGRVFFTSNRDGGSDIWSMNADGSRPFRLTSSGDNLSPALSPDGTRVAFTSGRDVWTMAIDGTGRVQITDTAAVEESPVWSPDGSRLAYVTSGAPDGGTDQEIVTSAASGTGVVAQLTSNTVPDTDPAWSDVLPGTPGGKVAFVSARAGDTNRNVYVMDAAGGPATSVTPNGTFGGLPYQGHDDHPAWSADGTIAYTHTFDPNGGRPAIWSVEPDGTGMTRLTQDGDRSASEPAWSPDGTELAFVTTAGTDRNIAVMSTNGTSVRTIDASTSHDIAPDWQEDSVDPETLLLSAPSATTESTTARLEFRSNEPGSDLACSLDGASYSACASPGTWTGLALGVHQLAVRAADPVGRVDPTPALVRWTVVAPAPSTPPVPPTSVVIVPPSIGVSPPPVAIVTPTVGTSVAAAVRLDRSAGRVPVRMTVSPVGSEAVLTVRARIGGRWAAVGRARTPVDGTGQVRVGVKIARSWRTRLDGDRVRARLDVVVTTSSGVTASSREGFVLRG